MPTLTLRQQNDEVIAIDRTAAKKLGRVWATIKKALAKVDPDRLLIFTQAKEIERLDIRLRTIGLVLQNVDVAQKAALREFGRLRAQGVDIDLGVVETLRGCLVERKGE